MTSQFFIPRHDRALLRRKLVTLPDLCEDLADSVNRQARLRTRYGKSGARVEPLPFDDDAEAVAAQLHNVLGGWVRLVLEHRGLAYAAEPVHWLPMAWMRDTFVGPLHPQDRRVPVVQSYRPPTTAALARWLSRNFYSLATTPGSDTALREISDAERAAERIVCPPPGVLPSMDAARVREARATYLSARQIATLARDLGDEYRNLTQRRVYALAEAGLIAPVPGPWQPGYPLQYLVGPVLDAHLALPIRQRHTRRTERASA
jgi:hypothetical protein